MCFFTLPKSDHFVLRSINLFGFFYRVKRQQNLDLCQGEEVMTLSGASRRLYNFTVKCLIPSVSHLFTFRYEAASEPLLDCTSFAFRVQSACYLSQIKGLVHGRLEWIEKSFSISQRLVHLGFGNVGSECMLWHSKALQENIFISNCDITKCQLQSPFIFN